MDQITLTQGAHTSRSEGTCAMEAMAFLAGLPHTDHPPCAGPVIGAYLRRINDARWSSDERRTEVLLPWVYRCLNTVSTPEIEVARARWLAHRAATWWAPLAGMLAVCSLENAGLDATAVREAYLKAMVGKGAFTAAAAYAYADAADAADAAYAAYVAASFSASDADADVDAAAANTANIVAYADAYAAYAAANAANAAVVAANAAVVANAANAYTAANAVGVAANIAANAADAAAYTADVAAASPSTTDLLLAWACDDLDALLAIT